MNVTKAKLELMGAIDRLFGEGEIGERRSGYVGDNISEQMATAALQVLLATEDVHKYLTDEGLIKE